MSNVAENLKTAPPPQEEGQVLWVDAGNGWIAEYHAEKGEWSYVRTVYPAVMD